METNLPRVHIGLGVLCPREQPLAEIHAIGIHFENPFRGGPHRVRSQVRTWGGDGNFDFQGGVLKSYEARLWGLPHYSPRSKSVRHLSEWVILNVGKCPPLLILVEAFHTQHEDFADFHFPLRGRGV